MRLRVHPAAVSTNRQQKRRCNNLGSKRPTEVPASVTSPTARSIANAHGPGYGTASVCLDDYLLTTLTLGAFDLPVLIRVWTAMRHHSRAFR